MTATYDGRDNASRENEGLAGENVSLAIGLFAYGALRATPCVARSTRHSWNVACNTRCLQGSEEIRGRVLQCNSLRNARLVSFVHVERGRSAGIQSTYAHRIHSTPQISATKSPRRGHEGHETIANLIYFHWGSFATFLRVPRLLKIRNTKGEFFVYDGTQNRYGLRNKIADFDSDFSRLGF